MMKYAPYFFLIMLLCVSCQREFVDEIIDKPTDKIQYISLTASQDTAKMFEPITITANVIGENVRYVWQRDKGTLIVQKGKGNVVQFWGCPTCLNWVTVYCTAVNEHGTVTRSVNLFITEEMYTQP